MSAASNGSNNSITSDIRTRVTIGSFQTVQILHQSTITILVVFLAPWIWMSLLPWPKSFDQLNGRCRLKTSYKNIFFQRNSYLNQIRSLH